MPNRIIKESICRSDSIDSLSWFEEVLFYRLIVVCDDYGRFDGRSAIIKGACFPLKDDITKKHISEAINKLSTVGLVRGYEVQGRSYLQLTTWDCHQQIRAKKSKYPSPDEACRNLISVDINKNHMNEMESKGNHLISDVSGCPRNRESKYENRESRNGDDMRTPVRIEQFDVFWDVYPVKRRKHLAEREYCGLLMSGAVTEDRLIETAKNYAEYCKRLEDSRYIKNADNFLRDLVFEDYLDHPTQQPGEDVHEKQEEEELIGDDWMDYETPWGR